MGTRGPPTTPMLDARYWIIDTLPTRFIAEGKRRKGAEETAQPPDAG